MRPNATTAQDGIIPVNEALATARLADEIADHSENGTAFHQPALTTAEPKDAESIKRVAGGANSSKTDLVLKKLRTARGATLADLATATGWQPHSVRGGLSGTVRKKLGLQLTVETGRDGLRRYRITRGQPAVTLDPAGAA